MLRTAPTTTHITARFAPVALPALLALSRHSASSSRLFSSSGLLEAKRRDQIKAKKKTEKSTAKLLGSDWKKELSRAKKGSKIVWNPLPTENSASSSEPTANSQPTSREEHEASTWKPIKPVKETSPSISNPETSPSISNPEPSPTISKQGPSIETPTSEPVSHSRVFTAGVLEVLSQIPNHACKDFHTLTYLRQSNLNDQSSKSFAGRTLLRILGNAKSIKDELSKRIQEMLIPTPRPTTSAPEKLETPEQPVPNTYASTTSAPIEPVSTFEPKKLETPEHTVPNMYTFTPTEPKEAQPTTSGASASPPTPPNPEVAVPSWFKDQSPFSKLRTLRKWTSLLPDISRRARAHLGDFERNATSPELKACKRIKDSLTSVLKELEKVKAQANPESDMDAYARLIYPLFFKVDATKNAVRVLRGNASLRVIDPEFRAEVSRLLGRVVEDNVDEHDVEVASSELVDVSEEKALGVQDMSKIWDTLPVKSAAHREGGVKFSRVWDTEVIRVWDTELVRVNTVKVFDTVPIVERENPPAASRAVKNKRKKLRRARLARPWDDVLLEEIDDPKNIQQTPAYENEGDTEEADLEPIIQANEAIPTEEALAEKDFPAPILPSRADDPSIYDISTYKQALNTREYLQRAFFRENPALISSLRAHLSSRYPFYANLTLPQTQLLLATASFRNGGLALGAFFEVLVELEGWPRIQRTGLAIESSGWTPPYPYTFFSGSDLRHTQGSLITDGLVGYIDPTPIPEHPTLSGTLNVLAIFEAKTGSAYKHLFRQPKIGTEFQPYYTPYLPELASEIYEGRVLPNLPPQDRTPAHKHAWTTKFINDNSVGGQLVVDALRMKFAKVIWYKSRLYRLKADFSKIQFVVFRPRELDLKTTLAEQKKQFEARGWGEGSVLVIESEASKAEVNDAYLETLGVVQEWGTGMTQAESVDGEGVQQNAGGQKTEEQQDDDDVFVRFTRSDRKRPTLTKRELRRLALEERTKEREREREAAEGYAQAEEAREKEEAEREEAMALKRENEKKRKADQQTAETAERADKRELENYHRSKKPSAEDDDPQDAINPRITRNNRPEENPPRFSDPPSRSHKPTSLIDRDRPFRTAFSRPLNLSSSTPSPSPRPSIFDPAPHSSPHSFPHLPLPPSQPLSLPEPLSSPSTPSPVAFYESYIYYYGTLSMSWNGGDARCVRIRTSAPTCTPVKTGDGGVVGESFNLYELPPDLVMMLGDLLERKEREMGGSWVVCSVRLVPKKVFYVMVVQSQYAGPVVFN